MYILNCIDNKHATNLQGYYSRLSVNSWTDTKLRSAPFIDCMNDNNGKVKSNVYDIQLSNVK